MDSVDSAKAMAGIAADRIVLGGGAELQRAIYALAASQLLSGTPRVVATQYARIASRTEPGCSKISLSM